MRPTHLSAWTSRRSGAYHGTWEHQLIVSGSHKSVKISYKCYEMYYRFELSTGENEFKLIIELDNLKDGYRILDLKKFPVDINKFKDK